ncbi:M20/M25/M40 family metallo-hydrolase [uncultured Amnibacterium sp.]|uniref:M20/M25/M40 family metallo-hydrolase n=1 Tax=uncultured Amnibacterium sp. TaxID=1631851 RepID=UPI0035CA852B
MTDPTVESHVPSRPLDATYLAALSAQRASIAAAVDFINSHPELAHEEIETCGYLADRLEAAGYQVRRGVAGMPTAFRAELRGALPGRRVGVATVYDAVTTHRPDGTIEAVPACGHGPMSGGILGTALALAAISERLTGSFVVVGCPADEIHSAGTRTLGSGKAVTAAAGVWDDIDVALYAHPEFIDTVWQRALWMRRETAIVGGHRSLVRGAPSGPMDALRELARIADETDPARLMVETAILDGDVEEGVGLTLTVRFLAFADTEEGLEEVMAPAHAGLEGAVWSTSSLIQAIRPDAAVTAVMADAFAAAGRTMVEDPPALPFATDFGNVTQRVPAAIVGVGRPEGWGFHQDHGVEQFAGAEGKELAESIATVVGLAAIRLTEPVG